MELNTIQIRELINFLLSTTYTVELAISRLFGFLGNETINLEFVKSEINKEIFYCYNCETWFYNDEKIDSEISGEVICLSCDDKEFYHSEWN